ncbi:MAG TPA: PRTRC system protein E, partial [Chryseobacterium sp.]
MQTNFFRHIAKMDLTGDLQITLRPTTENNFVLSILLNNEQCGDDARKLIPPLNLRGTAEELDNGFFERITKPLQTASGLMVDMEAFMKQLEEVKMKSAMEKEKTDKEKKEKDTKEKKYKDALQKAEELEKEGKYKDA